jgi:HEAT repeat protein
LIHLLGDPDSGTRSKAIEALAKFGPDARPALPQIIQALEDLDYNVRVHATNIVQNLDPEAAAKAGIK